MPDPAHGFRRLVLGLETSRANRAVKLGVDFANLLHLDLLGLFIEDAGLRQLADMPFLREFRPFGGGWQPIERERLLREMDLAARSTERLFVEAAKFLATRHQFEVVRSATQETIASISRADDIVMVAEPPSAAERAALPVGSFGQTVLQSAASVLFAPRHPLRSAGAVVAVASPTDPASMETAVAIAAAAREELIILAAGQPDAAQKHAGKLPGGGDLKTRYIDLDRRALADPYLLAHALGDVRERLIVAPRGALAAEAARALASLRRVPVLLVEAPRLTTAREWQR